MSTNHRAQKVPRDTERGRERGEREGELIDMKKDPLLRRAALINGANDFESNYSL